MTLSHISLNSDVVLRVNGKRHELRVDNRSTLLDTLREQLGLTGTKKGCDQGQCGACTVLVDGERANSCLLLAVAVADRDIVSIEGVAELPDAARAGGELHPVQEAFLTYDGLQCGYCTPGQICSAVGALGEAARGWPSVVTQDTAAGVSGAGALNAVEVRERMSGNLCRCGAYGGIVEAVLEAASASTSENGQTR
jgi:xanthine dehydrogenase YagT iron-sulfur-binding subunit